MVKQCTLSLLFMLVIVLTACSDSEEKKDVSTLEEKQKQIAQETVEYIKVPVDKANIAKQLSEDHLRKTEEAVPKQ